MNTMNEKIEKAIRHGFSNISLHEMRNDYGDEIADALEKVYYNSVKKNVNCYFTIDSDSKITIKKENDNFNIKFDITYITYNSWFSRKNKQIEINKTEGLDVVLDMYIKKFENKYNGNIKKFIQKEETKYFNNEYDNMPSLDYNFYNNNSVDFKTSNFNAIDWNLVKSICNKYGLSYTFIKSTFGGNGCELIIYFKTSITAEQFKNWRKKEDYDSIRSAIIPYKDICQKLHDCVHELDEYTNFVFRTCNNGNCGLFSSNDVRRRVYSFGDYLYDWDSIIDSWSPLIYDTNDKLSKGVYLIMTSRYLKSDNILKNE